MNNTKYLLIPQWRILNNKGTENCTVSHAIPSYYIKLFDSKKEIEAYLNSNDLESELHKIMLNNITERYKEDIKKSLKRSFDYERVEFWVVAINPVGKENRIGIMQHEYNDKIETLEWKYRSYFGGKAWKDELLGNIYI